MGQFCNLLARSGYIKNHLTLVEIQVENLGSNIDLKIVLVWFWLFHVGFQTWCQFFSLKVMFIGTYTF